MPTSECLTLGVELFPIPFVVTLLPVFPELDFTVLLPIFPKLGCGLILPTEAGFTVIDTLRSGVALVPADTVILIATRNTMPKIGKTVFGAIWKKC